MLSPREVVEQFMSAFIRAWPTKDASGLLGFFRDDAVYHNIPLEAVSGRKAIGATLEAFMDMGGDVEVEVANVVESGNQVVVERVDHFVRSGTRASLAIMGIFEVEDGLIVTWRDYFDLSQFRS